MSSKPDQSLPDWVRKEPFVEEKVEALLSHPHRLARSLPFALEAQAPHQRLSTIAGWMEIMEASVAAGPADLDLFARELVRLGMPQAGFEERSRARVIYKSLREWLMLERARRDPLHHSNPSPDWLIPDHALALMIELDEIGAGLRGRWLEANTLHAEMARESALPQGSQAERNRPPPLQDTEVDPPIKPKGKSGQITHAPDFAWMIARGQSYNFTTPNQRLVIAALFEAWTSSGNRDGHGLSEAALAAAIGAPSSRPRVRRLFAKNGALGTIVDSQGKGMWALYLLAPPPKQT